MRRAGWTGGVAILTAGEVKVESAVLVFAEKESLGYVSDHIGLRARLSLTPGQQAAFRLIGVRRSAGGATPSRCGRAG
jgi:hypothetical protein